MSFKKVLLGLFFIFSLFPYSQIRAEASTGFVPSNIWYSNEPFEEGDKIKIYTVVFNGDTRELTGTVSFYDGTMLLGKKTFSVAGRGVKDISIDWTVNAGEHKIFGKIDAAKYSLPNGNFESTTLKDNITEVSNRTVKKKIVLQATNKDDTTTPGEIERIADAVKTNTPYSIQKPILSSVNVFEGIRSDLGTQVEAKITSTSNELEKSKSEEKASDPKSNNTSISKPFKYAELFLLKIASFILNYKIIYYGIILLILFLMVRYIWRLFL